jgi:hypothetical protein
MKTIISLLLLVGFSVVFTESVSAAIVCSERTPRVAHRQQRQQRRIYRGVRSGELTRRETFRLEREQYRIQRDKQRAKADGDVTARERARLRRELNRSSRHIYHAKHNRRDRN